MANVKITREHNLGIAQAMIRARGLVDGLAEQYGLKIGGSEYVWSMMSCRIRWGIVLSCRCCCVAALRI